MLIEQIEKEENFTNTDKALASYILSNADKVVNQTLQQIAAEAFVSSSAVTRFCKRLGFENFSAFKVCLSKEMTEEYRKMHQINPNFPFLPTDTTKELVEKVASISISNIMEMRDNIDLKKIERICKILERNHFIDIYGVGLSMECSREFCEKMGHIGYHMTPVDSPAMRVHRSVNSGPDQCALMISYSGEHEHLLGVAKRLKENQTPLIVITANNESKLLKYATCSMVIQSEESLLILDKVNSFGVMYMLHYVFDCIFASMLVRNYDENLKILKKNSAVQYE
jgi:DNA-binding MurR/RpiR family transcriptional regulator